MESNQPQRTTQEQVAAEELRKAINTFFERAEQFDQTEGTPPSEDKEGQELFIKIFRLLERAGVDMEKWEALGQNQVWILEVIAEGADPATAVEASYYELTRPEEK